MSEIEPMHFVEDQLPELILSSDAHSLLGAVACAEYLDQQMQTRETSTLLRSTRNVHTVETARSPQSDDTFRYKLLLRVGAPLFKVVLPRNRGIALFSLAQQKATSRQVANVEEIAEDFRRPMRVTRGASRASMLHTWLLPYARSLPQNPQSAKVSQACFQVAREYNRRPFLLRED